MKKEFEEETSSTNISNEILNIIEDAKNKNEKSLDLRFKQIDKLPKEIGNLTNLQALNISNNQLQEFPKEINQLINLKILDISNNMNIKGTLQLSNSNLEELDIENTNIDELIVPSDNKLRYINIKNTPLKSLPQSICDKIQDSFENINIKHSYSTNEEMIEKLCTQ